MSLTDNTKPSDVVLNTDLYELTMAQGFWESDFQDTQTSFAVFFRDNPFHGGYAISCGVGQIQDLIENFTFDSEDIAYLRSIQAPQGGSLFKEEFLDWLSDFRLRVSVWAVPEGEVVFPREPMVRVEGPAIDCQLIETALLNLVNFQTLVATKASRVVQAAQGRAVSDFGLRRAQGPDGGLAVARAAYVGGAGSTSNCLAGKIYDIPVFGTHAHSWVMAFPSELEAFRAFAKSSPRNCVLLVDTYDVCKGIENAITVAHEMEEKGLKLAGIRIDSGDLAKLSKYARKRFDEAGLPYVKISVSNDLDEYTIQSLLAQGAPIDSFGVGTKLATCDPQPSLGGVYKLCATKKAQSDGWRPVMKVSEMAYKRTIPGRQSVVRYYDESGFMVGDVIVDPFYQEGSGNVAVDVMDSETVYHMDAPYTKELLVQLVQDGKVAGSREDLKVAKERCEQSLAHLDQATRRFLNPQSYPVGIELGLAKLRNKLVSEVRSSPRRRS